MLAVGNTMHRLCLLDTMALSEMVKQPKDLLRHFLEWAFGIESPVVPCFTAYTVLELRRCPRVFEAFIKLFDVLPCVLLKSFATLVEDEVTSYPDPSALNPCALALLANIPQLLGHAELADWARRPRS